MKKRVALAAGLGATGAGLYRLRRRVINLALRLPAPENGVCVQRDIQIPMTDGCVLRADHYIPQTGAPAPTILIRTIYGRGREAGWMGLFSIFLAQRIAEHGYHVVVQNTRGSYDSEGRLEPFVNEAPDGRDTLAWIGRQPWFNGALGAWGPSYLGYVQWALAGNAPPYLKALAPSIITTRLDASIFPDGAFALEAMLRWVSFLDAAGISARHSPWLVGPRFAWQERRLQRAFQRLPLTTTDAVATGRPISYYRDWLSHPSLGDSYWNERDLNGILPNLRLPVLLVSGWYDFLLRGLLDDYRTLRASGQQPYLTVGPWTHLGPALGRAALREGLVWFDHVLKGDPDGLRHKPVRIYVMGSGWRELDDWPPPASDTRLYLEAGDHLAAHRPERDSQPDRYRYDPADPTPSIGGPLFSNQAGMKDNRCLEARADVLTYTTDPLAADVEVIGAPRLELFVRSTLEHTDFFGRICEVQPDGTSLNVCDGLLRLTPGTRAPQSDGCLRIEIPLWPTAYRFRAGGRLRLQVSSGAHPRWSRNVGTGEPLATAVVMQAAEQEVFHDAAHPSALVLPRTSGER